MVTASLPAPGAREADTRAIRTATVAANMVVPGVDQGDRVVSLQSSHPAA